MKNTCFSPVHALIRSNITISVTVSTYLRRSLPFPFPLQIRSPQTTLMWESDKAETAFYAANSLSFSASFSLPDL